MVPKHGALPGRSELRAVSGTAAARLRAEQDWLQLGRSAGLPVHAFRLGGALERCAVRIRYHAIFASANALRDVPSCHC